MTRARNQRNDKRHPVFDSCRRQRVRTQDVRRNAARSSLRSSLRKSVVGGCLVSLALLSLGCATSIRRDHMLRPQKEGTRLTGFGFIGPGGRVTLDNRVDLEEGSSQLRTRVQGDANFGYAEGSVHADLQWLIFTVGGSAGYRYGWHTLQFTPDETGLDNGESELNIDARLAKDEADDFFDDTWAWGEGRFRMVAPWENVLALSTVSVRHEERQDRTYGWEFATVYNGGILVNWESAVLLHHRHLGFIGPTVRLLNLPRVTERENELQYGIAAGTTPGFSEAPHALLLRVYTTAGFDTELMGQHFYRVPIQLLIGYQQDFEL